MFSDGMFNKTGEAKEDEIETNPMSILIPPIAFGKESPTNPSKDQV